MISRPSRAPCWSDGIANALLSGRLSSAPALHCTRSTTGRRLRQNFHTTPHPDVVHEGRVATPRVGSGVRRAVASGGVTTDAAKWDTQRDQVSRPCLVAAMAGGLVLGSNTPSSQCARWRSCDAQFRFRRGMGWTHIGRVRHSIRCLRRDHGLGGNATPAMRRRDYSGGWTRCLRDRLLRGLSAESRVLDLCIRAWLPLGADGPVSDHVRAHFRAQRR